MMGGDSAASADVDFTLWMRPKKAMDSRAVLEHARAPVSERTYLSRVELRRDHDADPDARSAIAERFRSTGATSVEHDWRRIRIRGARSACTRGLAQVRASSSLSAVVAVLGLDPTTPTHANAHLAESHNNRSRAIADVARAYRFPNNNGQGQTIAIVHFTGSSHAADLASAMTSAKLPVPPVRGYIRAAKRSAEDLELALDTQILATVANGAALVLYAGENDAQGYADALACVLLDLENAPQVISLSYGVPEAGWPHDALRCIEHLLEAAALCGITVVAASGDAGAPLVDGHPQVDYPASSRLVLACGGTDLRLYRGRRLSEHVWNEGDRSSGGGYSRIFARTAWASQQGAHGRGVPDVAAHAASAHGYRVHIDDKIMPVGGTSAAAPLWAGLIALLNQSAGKPCGLIAPRLYEMRSPALFYDVTVGTNGRYDARAGWDACTGLGAPRGDGILRVVADQ